MSSGPLGDPPDSGSNQTSSSSSEVETAAGSNPVQLLAQVQPCCNEMCPSQGPVLSAQLTTMVLIHLAAILVTYWL